MTQSFVEHKIQVSYINAQICNIGNTQRIRTVCVGFRCEQSMSLNLEK